MKNQLIKITLFLSVFSLAMPFATASSQTQQAVTKSMESDTKKPSFSILNNAKITYQETGQNILMASLLLV